MKNQTGLLPLISKFFRWSTTPPQAYIVFLILILAVGGLSFLAGTLKPKQPFGVVPQSISVPHN